MCITQQGSIDLALPDSGEKVVSFARRLLLVFFPRFEQVEKTDTLASVAVKYNVAVSHGKIMHAMLSYAMHA